MKALLIRHAHAIEGQHGADFARWLADKGRRVARKVGERLAKDGIAVDAVVSSPLVRAVQTAELVCAGLGFRGEIEILPDLAPDESVAAAAAALALRGGVVMAVGHEPHISGLAAHLLGRSVGAFKKAQALLVVDGTVAYRLDPDTV